MSPSKAGDQTDEARQSPEGRLEAQSEADKAAGKLRDLTGKAAERGQKKDDAGDSARDHLPEVKIDGAQERKPEKAKLTTDERGQITRVEAANGNVREFKWGADGKICEMKDATGLWKSSDGLNWVNEKGQTWKGRLELSKDGTYKETAGANGAEKICGIDGSVIRKNREGQVTELTTATGKRYQFEYDGTGRLTGTCEPDGLLWRRAGDNSWLNFNVYGQPTGVSFAGEKQVLSDGSFQLSTADGWRQTIAPDGLVTSFRTDGSKFRETVTEKDGSVTEIYYRGGKQWSSEQQLKDGTIIQRDKDDHITRVEKKGGEIRTFERDEKGRLVKIHESNGTEWTSTDGKTFKMKGSGVTVKGEVIVEPDGSYRFRGADGSEVKRDADGAVSTLDAKGRLRTRANADGSALAFDEQGRVTDSTDARGQKRSFGYDAAGRLDRIIEPDGSVWSSADGKSWQKQGTRESRHGEVQVGADGSYTVVNGKGGRSTFKLDGSQVTVNEKGQVVAVKDTLGKERAFAYNDRGLVIGVREPDGSTWTSADGQSWVKKPGGSKWEGAVSVAADGIYVETGKSGYQTTRRTDGWRQDRDTSGKVSLSLEHADGSTITKNQLGQVTEIKDAKGASRKFEYDQSGRATTMVEPSGFRWQRGEDNNWLNTTTGERKSFEIEARLDGIYRERLEGGREKVVRPDGAALTRDEKGRVTEIIAAGGAKRSFEYGADGKINKMVGTDGATWTTADGTNWVKAGSNEKWRGTVAVRADGTYEEKGAERGERKLAFMDGRTVVYDAHGKPQSAAGADGQSTRYLYNESGQVRGFIVTGKDGRAVELDDKNRVLKTKDATGAEREFAYGADGKVNMVRESGKTWTTADGKAWTSDRGDTWSGQVFVTGDGRYHYTTDGKSLTTKGLDGNSIYRDVTGAQKVTNPAGQIIETTNSKGEVRKFEYDAGGRLTKMVENGVVWQTSDGTNWTKNGGRDIAWRGTVKVEPDGTVFEESASGNRTWKRPDGTKTVVDYKEMEAACDAIYSASEWSLGEGGTDEPAFYAALEGKSVAQRQMMNEIYQSKYGKTIEQEARDEMEGSDLEKALSLLQKPDGADNAGTVRVSLVELSEWGLGARSNYECERVLRNTLETMSAAEIAEADRQYRERYGESLHDAVMNNGDLSQETKDACAIYLRGYDNRSASEVIAIAKTACDKGNPSMFEEAMRRAPKEARDYFASEEGQKKIKDGFEGHWYHALTLGLSGNVTDTEFQHMKDYAELGKLSVSTQVKDNTSWLGDNEKAIELSLSQMTDQERKSYQMGRLLANGETLPDEFKKASAEERKKALEYYTSVSTALKDAAGKWFSGDSQTNEFAKWEDMIASKGGSLVSRLADHRGHIYDSNMHDIMTSIEDMSEDDWKRLTGDRRFKEQIETVLKTYLSDEDRQRCLDLLKAKAEAGSFEKSREARRPLLDAIEDNKHWYNNDEGNIYRMIEKMTPAEQESYRQNTDGFRDRLDAKLKGCLDESEQKVAFGLLAKVDAGQKPEMSIMDKLNLQASYTDADEAQVIRDIEEAFAKDATLRERLNNPQTESDRKFAAEFKDAARRAMGGDDYEKYARPLIETGHLAIELKMELNKGFWDDDEQGAYRDIQKASAEERQKLLTDKAFQDKVMAFLSEDERKIALAAMSQPDGMRAEDKLRSYMVGAGTSEDEIRQVFAEIRERSQYIKQGIPEDQVDKAIKERLDEVRREYARKYGADLNVDFVSEMSGTDMREVQRMAHVRTAREEFLFAEQQASESRSGFGSAFVDAAWDGTGFQMDDARNAMARAMVLDPEKVHEFAEELYKTIDMHAESKEGLADAIVDTTLAAVALAAAIPTGGSTLLAYVGLVARGASMTARGYMAIAAAGAAFKIGTKGLIMGEDYDLSFSQLALDGGTGAIDAATAFWAGGVLAVGRSAGYKAAKETIEQGGKSLLKEGTEAAFKREAAEIVVKSLQSKTKELSDDAIRALARKYGREGSEEALAQMLKKTMSETVDAEAKKWLRHIATEMADNAFAGGAGGYASGLVRAAATTDSFEEFMQVSTTAGAFGAAGGAGFTVALKPIGWAAGKTWAAGKRLIGRADDQADNALSRVGHEGQPVEREPVRAGREKRAGQAVDDGLDAPELSSGRTMADAPPASDYVKGKPVKVDGEDGVIKGYDPIDGDAVVHLPGRGHDAIHGKVVPADELGSKYKPIDIDGHTYYRNAADPDGRLYMQLGRTGDGKVRLIDDPSMRLVPRERLAPGDARAPQADAPPQKPVKEGDAGDRPPSDKKPAESKAKDSSPERTIVGDAPPVVPRQKAEAQARGPSASHKQYEVEIGGIRHQAGKPELTIGRSQGSDLSVPNRYVSSNHARLKFEHDGVKLENLDPTNGTYVNGRRLGKDEVVTIRPGDRVSLGKPPQGVEVDLFHKPPVDNTRPREVFRIGERELKPGDVIKVGRSGSADVRVDLPGVSRDHMTIKVGDDGVPRVFDNGSTNGTFVNGKRVPAEGTPLKRGDKISYGDGGAERVEFPFAAELKPTYTVKVGPRTLEISPDKPVPIGRGRSGVQDGKVSRNHASIGVDEGGLYIVDTSTNGVYITRDGKEFRIPASEQGKPFYLKPTDQISLGKPLSEGGERVHLVSLDAHPDAIPPLGTMRSSEPLDARALKQSNDYAHGHEVKEPLEDGWHNAGRKRDFERDGRFRGQDRPATVVDRENDPVLRQVIEDAKARFGHLPPRERAEALARYAKELLTPPEMVGRHGSEKALDDWYEMFNQEHAGERILLGEFIRQGKGVCSQQATLLKVLADEFPDLKATLVRGNGSNGGNKFDHAWTTFDFGDGQPLIYDPRQKIYGKAPHEVPTHKAGADINRDIGYQKPAEHGFRPGDKVRFQDTSGWRVESVDPATKDAVLVHDGVKTMRESEFKQLNGGSEPKIGERYVVKRSNGAEDPGWRFEGRNEDGSLRFFKEDAIRVTAGADDLADAVQELAQKKVTLEDLGVRLDPARVPAERIKAIEAVLDNPAVAADLARWNDTARGAFARRLQELSRAADAPERLKLFVEALESRAAKSGADVLHPLVLLDAGIPLANLREYRKLVDSAALEARLSAMDSAAVTNLKRELAAAASRPDFPQRAAVISRILDAGGASDLPLDALLHGRVTTAHLERYHKLIVAEGKPAGLEHLSLQRRNDMDDIVTARRAALEADLRAVRAAATADELAVASRQLEASSRLADNIGSVLDAFRAQPDMPAGKVDDVVDMLKLNQNHEDLPISFKQVLDPKAKPESVRLYRHTLEHSVWASGADALPKGGFKYENEASAAILKSLADNPNGPLGPDWVFVPSGHNSPADGMGIDGMLINIKTNKAVPIDFAMNPYTLAGKLDDPANQGRFALYISRSDLGDANLVQKRLREYIDGTLPPASYTDPARVLTQVYHQRPPVLDLDKFSAVPGQMEPGKLVFPSFRAVLNSGEAAALRVPTSWRELELINNQLKKSRDGATGAERAFYDYLENRSYRAIKQRQAEVSLAENMLPAVAHAIDRRAMLLPGDSLPPLNVKATLGKDMSNPAYPLNYLEIGSPGGPVRLADGSQISQLRVYENGMVVGVGKNSSGNPIQVEVGNLRNRLKSSAAKSTAGQQAVDNTVDSLIDKLPDEFDFSGATSVDNLFKQHEGLQALAEAWRRPPDVAKAATDSRARWQVLEEVERNVPGISREKAAQIARDRNLIHGQIADAMLDAGWNKADLAGISPAMFDRIAELIPDLARMERRSVEDAILAVLDAVPN